jgi:hypothetical protein
VLSEIARRSAADSPEGGGLLLGTVRYAGAYTVTIESIDGIEGRFWRGFSQSQENPERRRFELALARWRPGADRPLVAVGYFRTEPADAPLGPGNDDLMLIARYFSAPHNVFLFVRPDREGGSATGGLVCWQFGQIPETAQEEFALDAPPFALAADPLQAPGPTPVVLPQQLEGAPAVIAIRRLWLLAALIGLLLIAGIGGGYFLMRRTPGGQPASPPAVSRLSLTAERSGTDYRVTWDRNAPAVLFAVKGVLTIADGGTSRVVDLDVSQLKGGSLLYTPGSGDVLIQLEVIGNGPGVTESVRVLAPAAGHDTAQAAPLVIKPAPAAAPGGQGATPVRVAPEPPPLVPTRAFTPPASSSSFVAVAAPPEMGAEPAVRWSAPVLSVPTQPPPVERPPEEEAAATPPVPRRVSEYRPPRPIEQPRPVMNQATRQALMSAGGSVVQVNVEIVIDRTGRVSTVKPFAGTDTAHKRLWDVAADAVRRWKFEPARFIDELVESAMTLTFRFGGSGSR